MLRKQSFEILYAAMNFHFDIDVFFVWRENVFESLPVAFLAKSIFERAS